MVNVALSVVWVVSRVVSSAGRLTAIAWFCAPLVSASDPSVFPVVVQPERVNPITPAATNKRFFQIIFILPPMWLRNQRKCFSWQQKTHSTIKRKNLIPLLINFDKQRDEIFVLPPFFAPLSQMAPQQYAKILGTVTAAFRLICVNKSDHSELIFTFFLLPFLTIRVLF